MDQCHNLYLTNAQAPEGQQILSKNNTSLTSHTFRTLTWSRFQSRAKSRLPDSQVRFPRVMKGSPPGGGSTGTEARRGSWAQERGLVPPWGVLQSPPALPPHATPTCCQVARAADPKRQPPCLCRKTCLLFPSSDQGDFTWNHGLAWTLPLLCAASLSPLEFPAHPEHLLSRSRAPRAPSQALCPVKPVRDNHTPPLQAA